MSTRPRVLITTVYRPGRQYYDYWASNAPFPWRPATLRRTSNGLRFLKQNVPEVEILEYPTWREYERALSRGWDVVGFSFYLNEIHEIIEMTERARRAGVKELWAGNYGALTEGIEKHFDRIFLGPAECTVGEVFGRTVTEIQHPPIPYTLQLGPIFFPYRRGGILFTSRSCPNRCTFCQTPVFSPKPMKISLDAIDRVLRYYRSVDIRHIVILDENFGMFLDHADEVFRLIGRYKMYAGVMTRADRLLMRLDQWLANGLEAAFIGVESLSQEALDAVGKRLTKDIVREAVTRLHERNCYAIGYYMIGFETDTAASIRRDITELATYGLDFHQVCVVTPLPRTPLWYEVERKYGFFEKDWHRYDLKHLTWNHPTITPAEMEELVDWSFRTLNRAGRYVRSIDRLVKRYVNREGFLRAWRDLLGSPLSAFFFDDRDRRHRRFL